jgi:hypothetical protein
MEDDLPIADRLYGTTQPQAKPDAGPEDPQPAGDQARADRMYGDLPVEPPRDDVPDAIRELRAADPARRLFGATAFQQDLPDGSLPGLDMPEARQCALDLGVEPADLRELRVLVNTEDEPDIEAWRVESHAMLKEKGFTATDLDAARQLARRDPRVYAFLDQTGLGDHPKVVERFVHLARRARVAGTLPHPKTKERK